MGDPLRILFIEDNDNDLQMLLSKIDTGEYELAYGCVDTLAGIADALKDGAWDIIISDYVLPDCTGLEALRLVQNARIDVPFIIVSGNIGEETAVSAMKAGAHDYVFKGNLKRLPSAIARELRDAHVRRARLEAEAQLVQTDARYKHLIEHIPAVVYWTDTAHPRSIHYISPQAETLLGLDPYAVPQHPGWLRDLVHPDEGDAVVRAIAEAIDARRSYRLEYRLRRPDGTLIWVLDSADVIPGAAGGRQLVQGILIDITDRKAAELAQLQHESELRTLAAAVSLAEERERRRLAVALHDQIGQELAFAKIELAALCAACDSAQSATRSARILQHVDHAYKQTRALTFDLSPPILYDLGLNAALEWISEQFGERHGLAIAVQCDEGVPPPDTETSVLLYRAVRELLTNVVKHAQAREVTIQARYRDGRAQVTVTDNGMGCDSAVLSIPVGAGSLGFGLRHLRERVRYRGGTLMITSSQGAGTSISITLPHTPIRPGGADEDSHHDR